MSNHYKVYRKHYQAYRNINRHTSTLIALSSSLCLISHPRNTPSATTSKKSTSQIWQENKKPIKMVVYRRDTAFNELFIKPICGLYKDHALSVDEFKEKNATLMKNSWIDTQHGDSGEQIYELYNPKQDGEIVKELLQEWFCDNQNEITQCIGITLQNHERSYAEWFKYVDDRSGPDELALYELSRKHGIHTAIFNKSYVWTTLPDHVLWSDEEIISLCGVNLVFLDYTTYGIIKDIRAPNPTDTKKTPAPTPAHRKSNKTTCHDSTRKPTKQTRPKPSST